ncbi:alkylated DNA repair protein alkB homolog 8 isoform X1 [Leptidea sinapis]|uniref:alkylated DNA repair protein alkB homolog 8 isoform X1 n=2 Tax=Leptidea sinapis TaxID=189913 RepID=UPI0021C404E7|nr:alkylated DNA repair protein alkB homolog 8 isoform X1 [Leptidea sinapis]
MNADAKRIVRKCRRFAVRLKEHKNVACIDEPTTEIVLCNVGQATGFTKNELQEIILEKLPNVNLSKYIAEKGESHSFAIFGSIEHSKLFFDTYNGKATQNGIIIYMSYVTKVPSDETIYITDLPSELHILHDFISIEEEIQFLKLFDWVDECNLKNRNVKHYGFEFRYGTNDVDLKAPLENKIPEECSILWERLKEKGLIVNIPDQLTVNKYEPGQGIPSHVDKHSPFGNTIISLSLGSTIVMDWRHHSGSYIPIVVPRRSMLIMQGEARYDWQHGIQPRTWDPVIQERTENGARVRVATSDTVERATRVSLTFRETRQGPCECRYETLCDSRTSETDVAAQLEELHVHQVYEKIACHFSKTRHKPWPKVVEFMSQVQPGSVVLDLGAGNGKNILNRSDIIQIAGERSEGLLWECLGHVRDVPTAQCVRLDLLHAGLRALCADVVICVAVVHHFCSQKRRQQAIATIARVLRSGGKALVTVWAKDQTNSNYICRSGHSDQTVTTVGGLNLPVHENRTQFKHNDVLVPWKCRKVTNEKLGDDEGTFLRYYHVFEEGELDSLCESEGLAVDRSFYEEGNWCVICTKP